MDMFDYAYDRNRAIEQDQDVRHEFPEYADEARKFMNKVLRQANKQMWLVFNGDACDHNLDLGSLGTAHWYISMLLECRAEGKPISDIYLENALRSCLGLGYAIIQGGKA